MCYDWANYSVFAFYMAHTPSHAEKYAHKGNCPKETHVLGKKGEVEE